MDERRPWKWDILCRIRGVFYLYPRGEERKENIGRNRDSWVGDATVYRRGGKLKTQHAEHEQEGREGKRISARDLIVS